MILNLAVEMNHEMHEPHKTNDRDDLVKAVNQDTSATVTADVSRRTLCIECSFRLFTSAATVRGRFVSFRVFRGSNW